MKTWINITPPTLGFLSVYFSVDTKRLETLFFFEKKESFKKVKKKHANITVSKMLDMQSLCMPFEISKPQVFIYFEVFCIFSFYFVHRMNARTKKNGNKKARKMYRSLYSTHIALKAHSFSALLWFAWLLVVFSFLSCALRSRDIDLMFLKTWFMNHDSEISSNDVI